jgi:hypothetical protein
MPFLSEQPIPDSRQCDQATLVIFAAFPEDFSGFRGPFEFVQDWDGDIPTWTTFMGPEEEWEDIDVVLKDLNVAPEYIE